METKTFILDFSDESIVLEPDKCKVFRFKVDKRKRKKTNVVEEKPKPKPTSLVSKSMIMDDIQFYLDLFKD